MGISYNFGSYITGESCSYWTKEEEGKTKGPWKLFVPVYSPARRKSKQKRKPATPKKTKRTVFSTLRKSPVKRKATSPAKSSPRKYRPRKGINSWKDLNGYVYFQYI